MEINVGVPLKLHSDSKSICKLLKSTKDIGSDFRERQVIECFWNHYHDDNKLFAQFVPSRSNMVADVFPRSEVVKIQQITVQIDKTQVKLLHEDGH